MEESLFSEKEIKELNQLVKNDLEVIKKESKSLKEPSIIYVVSGYSHRWNTGGGKQNLLYQRANTNRGISKESNTNKYIHSKYVAGNWTRQLFIWKRRTE